MGIKVSGRFRRRTLWTAAVLVGLLAIAGLAHRPLLTRIGRGMAAGDGTAPADLLVWLPESGIAGLIEGSDLFRQHLITGVVLLIEEPNAAALELARRGVNVAATPADLLAKLGVPPAAIMNVPA